jgi:GH24 family phage-related lysozyme (muramidase)
MKRCFVAALAAVALSAGTPAVNAAPSHEPLSARTCTAIGPPCTAIVPEGARGKDVSRFVEDEPPLTLIGGAIQLDNFGAELTGSFENVYQAVYCPFWDAYGHVWTRALGETDWSGDFGGRCITRAQAVTNLRYLMDTQYLAPVRALGVNFSHDQVDALGDLSYNVGPGTICCTLASLLRAHDWAAAGAYILRYSYAGGVYLAGLHARREREDHLLQVAEHPETAAQRRAREEKELAGHRAVLVHLDRQRHDIQAQLTAWGCRRLEAEHRTRGPKCKGAEAAGERVDQHIALESGYIAKLAKELA